MEDAAHFSRVVDYIHLNPVRAGIVATERLLDFKPSSLPRFVAADRSSWLIGDEILETAGLNKSGAAWKLYVERLMALASAPGDDERMHPGSMSAGWAIGTNGWRKALAKEYSQTKLAPEWANDELSTFREDLWRRELEAGLAYLGHTLYQAGPAPNLIGWKLQLALRLRRVAAPYRWIASTLNMGSESSVRAEISRLNQQPAG